LRHLRTSKPSCGYCHSPLITLAVIACAVAIAACGSSSKPPSAGGPRSAAGIKFADCMRAKGVPNFPDPSAGGGIQIPDGSGINPLSPSFKAAQASCAKLLPGGGPGHQHPSERQIKLMLETSQCMRRHGISAFPDPTLTPPSSPAGYSVLIDRGGVVVAIPNTIDLGSPAFQQAAAACGFPHLGRRLVKP
jgi:hypothetical protein